MGKQHSDPPLAASLARGTSQVPPVCQPRALPSSRVSVLQQLCKGREGWRDKAVVHPAGISRHSGKADPLPKSTPNRSMETPIMQNKCLFARARQEGCTLQSGKVSMPRVGAQRPHTLQSYLPYNHIIPFPPEKPSGPPARQAAHQLRGGCET